MGVSLLSYICRKHQNHKQQFACKCSYGFCLLLQDVYMYLQETKDHERIRSQMFKLWCMRYSFTKPNRDTKEPEEKQSFFWFRENLSVLGLSGIRARSMFMGLNPIYSLCLPHR